MECTLGRGKHVNLPWEFYMLSGTVETLIESFEHDVLT